VRLFRTSASATEHLRPRPTDRWPRCPEPLYSPWIAEADSPPDPVDEAPILSAREVARDVLGASKRGWPLVFGLPLALALVAGVVQWLLEGANQKAWNDVTASAFLASLITLAAAIALMVVFQITRAPLMHARSAIADHRATIRQLQDENVKLRAKVDDDDDEALMADLTELATEIDAFWTDYDASRRRQTIPSPEAGTMERDFESEWSERFSVRAFWICDRLHRRTWLTTERWVSLRDPGRSYWLRWADAIVTLAVRTGAIPRGRYRAV
jgi:hypothetical protein